ncbi:MAG: hypothetical protein HZC46_08915, partial [Ignavibacterium album]|nr:hypothetical protein [Ignavibacterium album]
MKKLFFPCLIIFTEAFSQTQYNVELKKIYCDWVSATSFIDSVETIIEDYDGNLIPPSNNFYYEYHVTTFTDPPNTDIFGGLGLNKTFEDNDQNFIQTWYVVVKDPTNQIIFDTSNTVSFQMQTEAGKSKQIIFQSLKNDGSPESGVNLDHWMYVVNLWNFNFGRFLTVKHDEVLRASPNFLTTNNDKFNFWNSDKADILNHNHFYYDNKNTEYLTANYKNSVNATVRAKSDSLDLYLDILLQFKDPWLRDSNEIPYGIRNQGPSAPFKSLPNTNNNLAINSNHQGVFLNQ